MRLDKSQTLADTGYKFIDKRINRQVQNNNPIMTLVGDLSYKAVKCGKESENSMSGARQGPVLVAGAL